MLPTFFGSQVGTREGKIGNFAILYREVRHPDNAHLQLIENASRIAGIAIERHMNEQALQRGIFMLEQGKLSA